MREGDRSNKTKIDRHIGREGEVKEKWKERERERYLLCSLAFK